MSDFNEPDPFQDYHDRVAIAPLMADTVLATAVQELDRLWTPLTGLGNTQFEHRTLGIFLLTSLSEEVGPQPLVISEEDVSEAALAFPESVVNYIELSNTLLGRSVSVQPIAFKLADLDPLHITFGYMPGDDLLVRIDDTRGYLCVNNVPSHVEAKLEQDMGYPSKITAASAVMTLLQDAEYIKV